MVPNEVLSKCEYDIANYIMPSGKNNEVDEEAYLNQEIEINAKAFAHKMMLEHYDLKMVISNTIFQSVKDNLTIKKGKRKN